MFQVGACHVGPRLPPSSSHAEPVQVGTRRGQVLDYRVRAGRTRQAMRAGHPQWAGG